MNSVIFKRMVLSLSKSIFKHQFSTCRAMLVLDKRNVVCWCRERQQIVHIPSSRNLSRKLSFHFSNSCYESSRANGVCKISCTRYEYMTKKLFCNKVSFLIDGTTKNLDDRALHEENVVLKRVLEKLREDNGVDICVVKTSDERRKYADYIVVVSGRSTRHLKAMTNHIHTQVRRSFFFIVRVDWSLLEMATFLRR